MHSFRNKRTRYELHNRDYIMLNNELSLFSTKGKSSKGGGLILQRYLMPLISKITRWRHDAEILTSDRATKIIRFGDFRNGKDFCARVGRLCGRIHHPRQLVGIGIRSPHQLFSSVRPTEQRISLRHHQAGFIRPILARANSRDISSLQCVKRNLRALHDYRREAGRKIKSRLGCNGRLFRAKKPATVWIFRSFNIWKHCASFWKRALFIRSFYGYLESLHCRLRRNSSGNRYLYTGRQWKINNNLRRNLWHDRGAIFLSRRCWENHPSLLRAALVERNAIFAKEVA